MVSAAELVRGGALRSLQGVAHGGGHALALKEQEPDYSGVLELSRALREQVDWGEVRERTKESPFAKAFFVLLDELDIVSALPQK